MSEKYNPQEIESKWQQKWEQDQLYRSKVDWNKPKHYAVTMLPYPSGDLHIGHWYAMTPSDTRARWMRMRGYNVLFPMGFDAFGLPAEQAAISRNIHPWKWTFENINRMRTQMRSMGAMFDWERETIACVPEYYKWTEWFFKKFYENGLAYRKEALVNWSETLQTVLANEQVIDGKDERTGQPVVQKLMEQWFFRITKFADELLDFSTVDWPEPIKMMQTNWIGRSEGARVTFHTDRDKHPIEIFTTRPDTLWGATFLVLAPEHELVEKITTEEQRKFVDAYIRVASTATEIERLSDDREKTGVFTGAYAVNPVNQEAIPIWIADYVMINYGTGAIMAVPAHDQRDFDFAKKYKLEIRLVIQPVEDEGQATVIHADEMAQAFSGAGVMIKSGRMSGSISTEDKGRKNPAIARVLDYLEVEGLGKEAINYRLRDWLISRQRYWGSPIPMFYDANGKVHPVPDEDLPVVLPEDVDFAPTGRSPLTYHEPFFKLENGARRETDTMDTFMCSSWYQLRYLSPHYDSAPFDPEEAAYWLPVDTYTGGAEHAVMHLLYTRFFTKALRDTGVFDDARKLMQAHGRDPESLFDEPMMTLRNQGQVLGGEREGDFVLCEGKFVGDKMIASRVEVAEKGKVPKGFAGLYGEIIHRTENVLRINMMGITHLIEVPADAEVIIPNIEGTNSVNQLKHHLEIQRMSKSKGNVVNPDELVQMYGADVVRAYLMFNFDWQKGGPWNEQNIKGPQGWLNDIWDIATDGAPSVAGDPTVERDIERKLHQTIETVSRGLNDFSFNTSIAEMMKFKNAFKAALKDEKIGADTWHMVMKTVLRLMAPFTPHVAEEIWSNLAYGYSIHTQAWPEYDSEKAKEDTVSLVVMINGKPRDTISVSADIEKTLAEELALASEVAKKILNGEKPLRVIFIPGAKGLDPKVNIVTAR